jgi:hypothetical protein
MSRAHSFGRSDEVLHKIAGRSDKPWHTAGGKSGARAIPFDSEDDLTQFNN